MFKRGVKKIEPSFDEFILTKYSGLVTGDDRKALKSMYESMLNSSSEKERTFFDTSIHNYLMQMQMIRLPTINEQERRGAIRPGKFSPTRGHRRMPIRLPAHFGKQYTKLANDLKKVKTKKDATRMWNRVNRFGQKIEAEYGEGTGWRPIKDFKDWLMCKVYKTNCPPKFQVDYEIGEVEIKEYFPKKTRLRRNSSEGWYIGEDAPGMAFGGVFNESISTPDPEEELTGMSDAKLYERRNSLIGPLDPRTPRKYRNKYMAERDMEKQLIENELMERGLPVYKDGLRLAAMATLPGSNFGFDIGNLFRKRQPRGNDDPKFQNHLLEVLYPRMRELKTKELNGTLTQKDKHEMTLLKQTIDSFEFLAGMKGFGTYN